MLCVICQLHFNLVGCINQPSLPPSFHPSIHPYLHQLYIILPHNYILDTYTKTAGMYSIVLVLVLEELVLVL